MAQTITLRAQGATRAREDRFRPPWSSRASRYFISPAWPAAIHSGKWLSSGASAAGAMPTRSKPLASAARFTMSLTSLIRLVNGSLFVADTLCHGESLSASREHEFQNGNAIARLHTFLLPSPFQGIRLLDTESRTFPGVLQNPLHIRRID